MKLARASALGIAAVAFTYACGGGSPGGGAPDAGRMIASAALPILTPCPMGWREVVDADGLTICDPWPESGYDAACAFDAMHVPGTAGCATIGSACAADGWPADLPSGSPVLYVDDGGASGADCSTPATACPTIAEAVARAAPGTVIAIAAGRYDTGAGVMASALIFWGACVSGTRLTSSSPGDVAAVLTLNGGAVHNLGFDGAERIAVHVTGGDVTVQDVAVDGVRSTGIWIEHGHGALTDVSVRRTRLATATPTEFGYGVEIDAGASGDLVRVVLGDNHERGLTVQNATATLTDVMLHGTLEASGPVSGMGLELDGAAVVTAQRLVVADNVQMGVGLHDGAAQLDASDLVIEDTAARLDGQRGQGLYAGNGSSLTLHRARVERSHTSAVFVENAGSRLEAHDVVFRDTLAQPSDHKLGRGIGAQDAVAVLLDRVWVVRSVDLGVFLDAPGATMMASDLVVSDVRARDLDGAAGAGMFVQHGAHAELTRIRVSDAFSVGIGAALDATLEITDALVTDIRPSPCTVAACADLTAGFGITSDDGASIHVTSFHIETIAVCGVVVGANDATTGARTGLDLAHGDVTHTSVGACLQVDGYDPERLHSDVDFVDVGVPLQATTYMLPTPL